MNRVTIDYGKAALTALLALATVTVCVLAHTLDGLSLVVLFTALTGVYVCRACRPRAPDRRGCRRL